MKITYFVHGTTFDNALKKCAGWKQVELNELGCEQALNLGNVTKDQNFDLIITSDLIRAIKTAEIAWPDVPKIADSRLRECNYGKFDGEHKSLVVYEDHITEPFPNGESLMDVQERMLDLIKEVKEKYADKNVAFVAHRAPQLVLECLTKNITMKEAIKNDWRERGEWQAGWTYELK